MTGRSIAAILLAALVLTAGCASGSASGATTPRHAGGADDAVRVLRGEASYYADSLAGNTTASGDVYDPDELTAASRTLPFGSRVRVVRRDNGRSVVVRINDRGPFGDESRILDLSRAAAERLDMLRAGVVPVRAEVLSRGEARP